MIHDIEPDFKYTAPAKLFYLFMRKSIIAVIDWKYSLIYFNMKFNSNVLLV